LVNRSRDATSSRQTIHHTIMKLKSLLAFVSALALCASFATADEKENTPLHKEMASLNRSLKTLKRQADDATKKADNLALIEKIKGNIAAALKEEPAKTKDQPAAEKPGYLEKYKKQMEELDKTFDELKAAIEKDDKDAVKQIFSKLGEEKEKGHKDFAPED
jgi:cytochrome c556